ncbi:MAG: hypothetical protein M1814_002332 [Vezdaea aestivalis]|nr:MAG: hypothetical protein M1814_002332 [Vezdaea aestivalis]
MRIEVLVLILQQILSAFGLLDGRILYAASRRQSLVRRTINFLPTLRERSCLFAEESSAATGRGFGANVHFTPRLPTLLLEDFEPELQSIRCAGSAISLFFDKKNTFKKVRDAWAEETEFYVVSSHDGCNTDGHRVAHLVSEASWVEEENLVILQAQTVPWSNMTTEMAIDFGKDFGHNGLRKRQIRRDSVNVDLTRSIVNQIISSAQNVSSDSKSILNTTVKCLDCGTSGSFDLEDGRITIPGTSKMSNYLEFDANNVAANVNLETTASGASGIPRSSQWSAPLPGVRLSGFSVPGVVSAGTSFSPVIQGSLKTNGPMKFTYGFRLTFTDKAIIRFYLDDPEKSFATGFNTSRLTPLPFSSDVGNPAVNASISFRPRLFFGASIATLDTGGAVFADLPRLALDVEQVSSVNRNCRQVDISKAMTPAEKALGYFQNNLTRVVPSVGIDIGIQGKILGLGTDLTIFNAASLAPLATQCLSYDRARNTLTTIDARNTEQFDSRNPAVTGGGAAQTSTSESGRKTSLGLKSKFILLAFVLVNSLVAVVM